MFKSGGEVEFKEGENFETKMQTSQMPSENEYVEMFNHIGQWESVQNQGERFRGKGGANSGKI